MKSLDQSCASPQSSSTLKKGPAKGFNNSYVQQRTVFSTGCWGQATSCSNFAQFSRCEYCIKYSFFLKKEKKHLQQQWYVGINMQFFETQNQILSCKGAGNGWK